MNLIDGDEIEFQHKLDSRNIIYLGVVEGGFVRAKDKGVEVNFPTGAIYNIKKIKSALELPYNIFLDEKRKVGDITWLSYPPNINWTYVKTFDGFISMIMKNGLPQIVSFAHNLNKEHEIREQTAMAQGGFNYKNLIEKTGYDAAKWLANFCRVTKKALPDIFIHEPGTNVGSYNIRRLFAAFKAGLLDSSTIEIIESPKKFLVCGKDTQKIIDKLKSTQKIFIPNKHSKDIHNISKPIYSSKKIDISIYDA